MGSRGIVSGQSVEPGQRPGGSTPIRRNHLLAALADSEFEAIRPDLQKVDLVAKQVLSEAGEHPAYAYFPEGGVLSFTLDLPGSGLVEFGIVGRDGLSSFSATRAGRVSPVRTVVQIGSHEAYRIPSERLRAAIAASPSLSMQVQDFLYNFMGQMAFTAVSNARHSLVERLSRWLLMCNDRLDDDEVPLTHEFMAMMLGAQRTSVTSSLHILEGEGAIRSRRGVVRILDRRRLERIAGEAYYNPVRPIAGP